MPFTGIIGRVAYAILAGVIAFIVFYIIGVLAAHFDANIGGIIEKFSPLIGLLVGIVTFFRYPTPLVP